MLRGPPRLIQVRCRFCPKICRRRYWRARVLRVLCEWLFSIERMLTGALCGVLLPRYFNMDQAILNALEMFDSMLAEGKLPTKSA